MKSLKFASHLIDAIIKGEKYKTWRVNDDKNISEGDDLSLTDTNGKEFAKAQVVLIMNNTLGELTPEDSVGNGKVVSKEDLFRTFSKYYKIEAGPKTPVKVIRFKLISCS